MSFVPSGSKSGVWIRASDHIPLIRSLSVSSHGGESGLLHCKFFFEAAQLGICSCYLYLLWRDGAAYTGEKYTSLFQIFVFQFYLWPNYFSKFASLVADNLDRQVWELVSNVPYDSKPAAGGFPHCFLM